MFTLDARYLLLARIYIQLKKLGGKCCSGVNLINLAPGLFFDSSMMAEPVKFVLHDQLSNGGQFCGWERTISEFPIGQSSNGLTFTVCPMATCFLCTAQKHICAFT